MTAVALVVAGFFVLVEANVLVLAIFSFAELRRQRFRSRFERLEDLMRSELSPPVSIVVPAFNEAVGIVDSVRSLAMLTYRNFEIVVVNDGSTDGTLDLLIDAFSLRRVSTPYRDNIPTEPVRGVFRTARPIPITVVDKANGGRADALNAGVNIARFPYVLLTDADVILDPAALLRLMRRVVEDRDRTVAVAGNIRPMNGCVVRNGRVVETRVPVRLIERMQLLEYMRAFLACRPGWSLLNAIPNVSGAFGLYRRDAVVAVGGLTRGHLGEDLDLTLRVHRHCRDTGTPYRIVYAPDAVCWTEVPSTAAVLRRQRIRWHRGLMTAIHDHWGMGFSPRYGAAGMLGWGTFLTLEFLGPVVEVIGWVVLAVGWPTGLVDVEPVIPAVVLALGIGALNSLVALFLDEGFGYFNSPTDALRLAWLVFGENLGLRQRTVLWRLRAMFGGEATRGWGAMPRRGVANLGS